MSRRPLVFCAVPAVKVNSYGPVAMVVPGATTVRRSFRWSKPPAIQVRAINSPKARTSDPAITQARRLDPTAAGLVSGLVVLASVTGSV